MTNIQSTKFSFKFINNVIQVKNFKIFEDKIKKNLNLLLDLPGKPMFQDFFATNQKENSFNRNINKNILQIQTLLLVITF